MGGGGCRGDIRVLWRFWKGSSNFSFLLLTVSKMEITSHIFFISDINDFVAPLFLCPLLSI